jgi:hypothetical protein
MIRVTEGPQGSTDQATTAKLTDYASLFGSGSVHSQAGFTPPTQYAVTPQLDSLHNDAKVEAQHYSPSASSASQPGSEDGAAAQVRVRTPQRYEMVTAQSTELYEGRESGSLSNENFLRGLYPTEIPFGPVHGSVRAEAERIFKMLQGYAHTASCALITNVKEIIVKALVMAERYGKRPTVHDAMQDWCFFFTFQQHQGRGDRGGIGRTQPATEATFYQRLSPSVLWSVSRQTLASAEERPIPMWYHDPWIGHGTNSRREGLEKGSLLPT